MQMTSDVSNANTVGAPLMRMLCVKGSGESRLVPCRILDATLPEAPSEIDQTVVRSFAMDDEEDDENDELIDVIRCVRLVFRCCETAYSKCAYGNYVKGSSHSFSLCVSAALCVAQLAVSAVSPFCVHG